MNQSPEIGELLSALSKAQALIRGAKEDSKNPFYKSNYADLTSVWAAARQPLTSHGLSVTQCLEYKDSVQCLVTILGHSSGQWIRSCLAFPEGQKDPQAIGKVITYYRRYMLAAIVGICPEDDDAESAMPQYRQPARPGLLTPDQIYEIETFVNNDPAKIAMITNGYKVNSLYEIPSDKFEAIMLRLRQKAIGTV